jgi:hypothetical protein
MIPPAVEPLMEFAKYGLLGSIVIILWLQLKETNKQLAESWAERINDAKALQTSIDGVQHAISSMNLQSENRTRASEAVAGSLGTTTQAVTDLSKEVARLSSMVDGRRP